MARRRSALWVEIGVNLALLTVAVSVLDAGIFWLATRYVLQEASVDLAESAAVVVAAEVGAVEPERWPAVIAQNRAHGLRGLAIWSVRDGDIVGDAGEIDVIARRTVATRAVYSEVVGDEVRVVAPVGSGRPDAVLSLRYPMSRIERPAWGVVAGHTLFASVVIGVFGWFLFRRNVVEPIRKISDATVRIAGGEFGTPVPDDAPEELAELAGALRRMGVALDEYRRRTADQLASLERANDELRRAQEALVRSEKLAGVGRLAAGLAHELGNPLAAVRGYLELVVSSPEADNDELLRRTQTEVERMHRLLRNLLDYARGEGSAPGPVRVQELLAEARTTVEHQAGFRGVEVTARADGGLVLRGEAAKLHQVLVNLLLNAAAAGATHIDMEATAAADGVHLRVRDDGHGISPEHRTRLFEPFFSTRPPGEGTGLGLAIALRIVEQCGGRIEVESRPGAGATFTLVLPAA